MQEITAKFTNHLKEALAKSLSLVVESNQNTVYPIHLLWALSLQRESIACKILSSAGVTKEKIENYIAQQEIISEPALTIPNLAEETKIIIEKAVVTANMYSHAFISTEHLLSGLLQTQPDEIVRFFTQEKIDPQEVTMRIKQTLNLTIQIPIEQPSEEFLADESELEPGQSALEFFTQELTDPEYLKDQAPVIGREQETQRLCTILGRKTKNNPILVGEPGVGKSAIVEGLAQRIAKKEVKRFEGYRVYALQLASLLAGTMYRGAFEARLQQLIEELKEDPKSILFIDEIHSIVGSGSNNGSLDAADILKPALARGEIRCIGATTFEEYKKWIESDGALERRFCKVQVEEPTQEETKIILKGIKSSYESHHRIRYSDQIIEELLELADIHFPGKHYPDKAIDVLDEIGSFASQKSSSVRTITHTLLIEALSHMTGTPAATIDKSRTQGIKHLHRNLSDAVIGQDEVITSVTHLLQRGSFGLNDAKKPLASFLFVGPSGVGKTELAKQIAKHIFQGPKPILRLDMSEYKEAFNASKLLGSPAGYIGYKDANVLSDHIKHYPRSVILFDEIEKAHPDIHNLLLQILEEGTIRDATGRELHFGHAVIVLTSNVGQELFTRGAVGFQKEEKIHAADIRSKLEDLLRPELLNRIDNVCAFNPLSEEALRQIAKRQLQRLEEKLAQQKRSCAFAPSLVDTIVQNSSKRHGARGISQYIAQNIEPQIIDQFMKKKNTAQIEIKE